MNAGVLEGLGVEGGTFLGELVASKAMPKEGRSWIGRTEAGLENGSGHCYTTLLVGAIKIGRRDTTEEERKRCRGGSRFLRGR